MPFTSSIYRIQLSRGRSRSQGFEPFSHNWQEPVIANSFPKGSSDWTRVYVLLRFPSIEVGQVSVLYLRLVRGLAQGMSERGGQSSSFFQKKVVESWSFTKRVVFKASELVELRAGTYRKECWQIDPRARGEGNWKQIKTPSIRIQLSIVGPQAFHVEMKGNIVS